LDACQEKLNIPDTGRKTVITGLITTDTLLNVRISQSCYISDYYINKFSENQNKAIVLMYCNGILIDSLAYLETRYDPLFSYSLGNYWSKNVKPEPGKEYRIDVKMPGLPQAGATTKIPEKVVIEHVDTSHVILAPGSFVESNKGLLCKIGFRDPKGVSNYYLLDIRRKPIGLNYVTGNEYFNSQDPILEEKFTAGAYGHIGFEGIAFSDKLIDGQNYDLSIVINGDLIGKPIVNDPENYTEVIYFRLSSITEEYFEHIHTLVLAGRNYGDPMAEPVIVYSNVIGGYGMFSGAFVSTYSLNLKH
jgi:hypothetical protein